MASENGRALRSRAAALLFVGVALVCPESAASSRWPATATVRAHGTGCGQTAFDIRDSRQEHTFTWVMNLDSVPPHLDRGRALAAVRRATATVARARTPCPLVGGDPALPRAIYSGPTGRHANVTSDEECFPAERSDGISVVSFGDLPDDVVAVTCTYSDRGDIWQSDVLLNDDPGVFTLDPLDACADSYDLQAVMTHERGHSFGLGHVPETTGADELTMSSFMGRCDASARTLGAGDVLGLRQIY
jgi:hypothetical protein